MSLADRFGGGLPRGFAPGMQALERLLGELGTAGTQAGTTLEGLDLSWAEPDLSLGGLTLPLTADEAEAEAAAGAAGGERRTVRPAARAGAPGGGSVQHGTLPSGAAALAGKVPAGGASQGLGLLAELAGVYELQAGGAAAPVSGQAVANRAPLAPPGSVAGRPGEARMRPASETERERWVPGHEPSAVRAPHTETWSGDPARQSERSSMGETAGMTPARAEFAQPGRAGLGARLPGLDAGLEAIGNPLAHVGSPLESMGHPLAHLGAGAGVNGEPGFDASDLPPWVPGPTPTPTPNPSRSPNRSPSPHLGTAPQEPSLLPPEWAGNWQPLYVAEEQAGPEAPPGRPQAGGEAPHGMTALAAQVPTMSPGAAPAATLTPTPPAMAVAAPDLESALGSALAAAVPGLAPSPLAHWAPEPGAPGQGAGGDGPRQQVHLSMQVQLQGGQPTASPGSEDLARRIKEILIAEARRHGIDL